VKKLRIIGGDWRGSKIHFSPEVTLRPTPDRVRETLFNWLGASVRGARCLDLFSGSGALGFEALSRGAGYVLMVDASTKVVEQLRENATRLKFDHVEFLNATLPETIEVAQPFDIVFLDPPFLQGHVATCVAWLAQSGLLAKDAVVYIEAEKDLSPLPIPEGWEITHHKITGQVAYTLLKSDATA